MNTKIVTLLTLIILCTGSAYSGETNKQAGAAEQSPVVTNQIKQMKGFMRETRVLALPDEASVTKVKAVIPRMKMNRKPVPSRAGPQNLEEASVYLAKNVSMAQPPSACLEHEGVFFFSGGRSAKLETNFLSGFAIRKGETAIYSWDEEIPKKDKN